MEFKAILEAVKNQKVPVKKPEVPASKPVDDGTGTSPLPQGAANALTIGAIAPEKLENVLKAHEHNKLMTHVGTMPDGREVVMYYKMDLSNSSEKEIAALTDYLLAQADEKVKIHKFNPLKPIEQDVPKTSNKPEPAKPNINKHKAETISNIQNILDKLSAKSLGDLLFVAKDYQRRDAKHKM